MFEVIVFVLILSFLVIIHELGHYFAARWAKVHVEEFGLGYPPRAVKLFTWANTVFSLNWIPFGGFVRLEGEDGPSTQDTVDKVEKTKKSKKEVSNSQQEPFYAKSVFQRLVIILGGVVVNFLFGIIAFSIVFTFSGIPVEIDSARIAALAPDSPAAIAEIPTNVEIIAIRTPANEAGEQETLPVSSNIDVIEATQAYQGEVLTFITSGACEGLSCQELAQEFDVYVRSESETPEGQGSIGIAFSPYAIVFYPWYEMPFRGIIVGFQQTFMLIVMTLEALQTMIVELIRGGTIPEDVAGPVGIVHQAKQFGIFDQGILVLLNFTGILSVSLAIMNLLPIPALDGGRAVFILAEPLVGKKRVQAIEGYANTLGFILLIGLIILITTRDIWRIIA